MDARTTPFTRITATRARLADEALSSSLEHGDAQAERVLQRLLLALGLEGTREPGATGSIQPAS